MIYTGPIDEFFELSLRQAALPLAASSSSRRSTSRRHQPVAVVNYPNEHPYTRITEFKHLTGQEHPKTSVVYEYPQAEGDPYYPVPRPENARALPAVPGAGRRDRRTCTSSGGWRPTSTTTWTRWSPARSRSLAACSSVTRVGRTCPRSLPARARAPRRGATRLSPSPASHAPSGARVAVVVPAYDAAAFLRRALSRPARSVLSGHGKSSSSTTHPRTRQRRSLARCSEGTARCSA